MKNTEKLYKETNEKFVQRVENMIYNTCGCDVKRAREVLEECLKRNNTSLNFHNTPNSYFNHATIKENDKNNTNAHMSEKLKEKNE